VQPQQQDNCQEASSAGSRRDSDQSPATAASAAAVRSTPPVRSTAPAAPVPAGAGYPCDSPIVGHRLANGYMAVHAMGQPCRYCEDGAAGPQPPGPAGPPGGRIARAARRLAAASAILAAALMTLTVAAGGGRAPAAPSGQMLASGITVGGAPAASSEKR